jgi:8-oxo-dGTP diphosphatase
MRPLSRRGENQAAVWAGELAAEPVGRVLASPARRCVATVAAIAENAGLLVEIAPFLAEGSDGLAALKRIVAASESAETPGILVACTHGDVLAGAVNELVASGDLGDPAWVVQKGGAIRLHVVSGVIVAASLVPAPR